MTRISRSPTASATRPGQQQPRRRRRRRLFYRFSFILLIILAIRLAHVDFGRNRWFFSHLLRIIAYDAWTEATAAICCIVRDEEAYLQEWIDYHLGIGFDHIYIYDNSPDFELRNWQSQHDDRLANKTTIKHFPGVGAQSDAYLDCAKIYGVPNKHRWIAYFDVDEYLALLKHDSVVDLLSKHCIRGALSINWRPMSWANQSQYAPLPVTKRFQYVAADDHGRTVHDHVKTVVFLPDMDLTRAPHAHFAFLKRYRRRVDTNGRRIHDKDYYNVRRPADVALLHHYHTKSWKEYIAKRTRGRAALKNQTSVPALILAAQEGIGLRDATHFDDFIWRRLKQVSPEYNMFDQDLGVAKADIASAAENNATMISVLCTQLQPNDEYYIDEWVDYHLAIGFSQIYLYDASNEKWMTQWAKNKQKGTGERVSVIFSAETPLANYQDCLERVHEKNYTAYTQINLATLIVNEFLVLPPNATLFDGFIQVRLSLSCAVRLPIRTFGSLSHEWTHEQQIVYEPLPVTKRFKYRFEGRDPPWKYILATAAMLTHLQLTVIHPSYGKYLSTGEYSFLASGLCPIKGSQVTIYDEADVKIYRYQRSLKECRNYILMESDGANMSCSELGATFDDNAWRQVKHHLPGYSGYDEL